MPFSHCARLLMDLLCILGVTGIKSESSILPRICISLSSNCMDPTDVDEDITTGREEDKGTKRTRRNKKEKKKKKIA